VFIDNRGAARVMTAHLLALGHRRIGLVTGHPDYATSVQRTEGYRDALAAAGIASDPDLEVRGDYDFASGARAGAALLALARPPSAIFACSDDMAAGVLAAAHGLGLSLPRDCSVAGFGDDALAMYVWPPLTTIRHPTRSLAWNAADLLLTATEQPEYRECPFELIVRASTAPFSR
jgi:LacI family transcriptional regulator